MKPIIAILCMFLVFLLMDFIFHPHFDNVLMSIGYKAGLTLSGAILVGIYHDKLFGK